MSSPRYSIGIDLGTSNCALAYVDLSESATYSKILKVSQLRTLDTVVASETLPSFCFLADKEEALGSISDFYYQIDDSDSHQHIAGLYAREQMSYIPGRVVHSAKSWLCHGGVNRRDKILPWGTELIQSQERISPVDVSALYLRHLKDEWNRSIASDTPENQFKFQDVTITVPASFDEVSQRLTLEAAKKAGYPENVRLLEEPQAAFYYWLETHENHNTQSIDVSKSDILRELCKKNKTTNILVCDIGGGTTDFSYFHACYPENNESSNFPIITRIAVSDHLLLGGDNIDLAIAHLLEPRFGFGKLSIQQWSHLLHQARLIKERLVDSNITKNENYTISIVGGGSGLFASTRSAQICKNEIEELLLEGFFPCCDTTDTPMRRTAGLTEWGLPFAADSAITKHLAVFLNSRPVDAILFTGGTLIPQMLRDRICDVIESWQANTKPLVLDNPDLMLAVAHGAAFYGWARKRPERKIKGGYSHSVYLEVESKTSSDNTPTLVCILPKGTEENTTVPLNNIHFSLRVDQLVEFRLWYSNHREGDGAGAIISYTENEFDLLPPVQTALKYSKKYGKITGSQCDVQLDVALNEIGILKLHCKSLNDDTKWLLDFNLRESNQLAQSADDGSTNTEFNIGVSASSFKKAIARIALSFGKGKDVNKQANPKRLIKDLEDSFGISRQDWNSELLRALWPSLLSGMTARGRSVAHETTWCNLAGFALRPGYGVALDGWRLTELWRVFKMGMSFPKEKSSQVQWWIMWRRVSGGLSQEQQTDIYTQIAKYIQNKNHTSSEIIRLVGALERLNENTKKELASLCIRRIEDARTKYREDYIWTLGRLGARVLLHAEANYVLSPSLVSAWFDKLKHLDWSSSENLQLLTAFSQIGRKSGDRGLDIPQELSNLLCKKLQQNGATPSQIDPIENFVPAQDEYRTKLFGEALPVGISLIDCDIANKT